MNIGNASPIFCSHFFIILSKWLHNPTLIDIPKHKTPACSQCCNENSTWIKSCSEKKSKIKDFDLHTFHDFISNISIYSVFMQDQTIYYVRFMHLQSLCKCTIISIHVQVLEPYPLKSLPSHEALHPHTWESNSTTCRCG